jgi:hypothetical protein
LPESEIMIRYNPFFPAHIRRFGALVLSIVLASVLLVSAGYVLLEQHHACTGEHCPICASVSTCVAALQAEGSGIVLAESPKLAAVQPALRSFRSSGARMVASSPVSRKVKLSD